MFVYQQGKLVCESVDLQEIAQEFDTPTYVYSRKAIEDRYLAYTNALATQDHLICYAVKANSSLAVLNILARLNAGFDIVSIGELKRCLTAGADASRIVFSGVGKTAHEIETALDAGIHGFNVESAAELDLIEKIAEHKQCQANVSVRVNPDVDANTHPHIATGLKEHKFGIEPELAITLLQQAHQSSHLNLLGIACHIGSQMTSTEPYLQALAKFDGLVQQLEQQGISLTEINIGGGLGICYQDEQPPAIEEFCQTISKQFDAKYRLLMEPGRSIVGPAGGLLMQVLSIKKTSEKNFVIVDAAMNDYLRVALYNSWQKIMPVQQTQSSTIIADIVGPVCESADSFATARELSVTAGDLLVLCDVGAYGYSMASTYNSRPRPAEVMVDAEQTYLINQRESLDDLFSRETLLP